MAWRKHLLLAFGVATLVFVIVGAAFSASDPNAVTFAISDDAAQRAFPAELGSARGIGIDAARTYVGWADVATRRPARPRDPSDPAYSWAQADADVARYGAAGLAVWIAFWRTPAWASGSSDVAVWPQHASDLGDFAFAVAKRYPQVKVFMDWNEPNLKTYAKPNTIAAYEPMARAVYAGVKAASPSAEVIAGNLGKYRDNGRDPVLWATTLRADGVPMDAFGIHPYPDVAKPLSGRAPRSRIDLFDVPALARIVGVPVAVTEFGWSSLLAGADNQAAWTAQAIDVARCTPGLSQLVFWGFHDHPVPAGQEPDPWSTYGWLDPAGAPKPVYATGAAALSGTPDCSTIGQSAGAPAGWPNSNTIPPAVNSAPICSALALSAVSGGSVSAAIACTDYDGDPLSYSVKTQPAHGSLAQSGSTVTYVSTPGYVGADSFTLAASDGTTSTAIPATVSVTAPVTTPPAATVSGAVTATSSTISLGLRCAGGTVACSGAASLSATLSGRSYSLGTQAVTLSAGTTGRYAITIPAATRTALRAYAGRTISLAVAFTVTSSDGSQHTTTTTVQLALPR
jgi:Bacterial Ig domain